METLTSLGEELWMDHATAEAGQAPPAFRVLLEGAPRPVHPTLRDDLYRIAREAIGNAFRHARAARVEADIRYDGRMLRLRVRDDGVGMDPHILVQGGHAGRWGLPGIRERARSIGGRLEVWSELGRGTEVAVTIPAAIAYREPHERVDVDTRDLNREGKGS